MAVRIRKARVWKSLTQVQLAIAVGVSRSAVAQWERESGGTHPSVPHLASIARTTGVTFEWLATGRGPSHVHADVLPFEPAVQTSDEVETRCLDALRRLPSRKKALIGSLVAELVEQVAP